MRREIEHAVSLHLGQTWGLQDFTDLNDRASHPAGLLYGPGLSVFAKLGTADDTRPQFESELRGLAVLRERGSTRTPMAIAGGLVPTPRGTVLLLEDLAEIPTGKRTPDDWRAIGRSLAALHRVHGERFGAAQDAGSAQDAGYFGPIWQDNRPVASNRWADFYTERRLEPALRSAVDSGFLPTELGAGVELLCARLASVCGPEPRPALLHGDAQQNNFVSTRDGAAMVDACPYFGHPEIDLAHVDYFQSVPEELFDGYREVLLIDAGFAGRRKLWRLYAYLAMITVDGDAAFGRASLTRLDDALRLYR